MEPKIPLFSIDWDETDVTAINEVIRRGTHWADGPEITRFEQIIAERVGARHAVTFNSGTSALHAALAAFGIGPGDEVIVPAFTFISTANSVRLVGAEPVFADIESDTYGLDPDSVRESITPSTKAIMPMHYGGSTCRVEELRSISDEHGVVLLEDAAESFGALRNGTPAGRFGHAAMYSFCQNKLVTTGEGGVMITDDDVVARDLQLVRSHGRGGTGYFESMKTPDYVTLGFNLRMPTMCAALGISQIARMDRLIDQRRHNASLLSSGIEGLWGIRTPRDGDGCRNVYQMYTIELPDQDTRDGLRDHLIGNGIPCKVYFDPIHLTPYYTGSLATIPRLPVTEDMASRVLTLPFSPRMDEGDIGLIVDAIRSFKGVQQ